MKDKMNKGMNKGMNEGINKVVNEGTKKVVIIGAGISGLAAGCYLQMNGYETQILEKHTIPGGLCTSWSRKGYCFDGCVHWLLGSAEGNAFHQLWSELIDMKQVEFVNHTERVAIEVKDHSDLHGNKVFHLYTDVDKLEGYLLGLSPEDATPIKEFTSSIRTLMRFQLPPMVDKAPEVRNLVDNLKMVKALPLLLFLKKWIKITNKNYAIRFKSPFLREAFELMYDGMEASILMMTMQLAFFGKGCAGYPVGGSLTLARRLAETYQFLGGNISYGTGASKILTKENKAVGVVTEAGVQTAADIVISAADWNFTIYEALEGKYTDSTIRSLKDQKIYEVFDSALLISLGVAAELSDQPHLLRFPLEKEWRLEDGSTFTRMEAHIYHYDKTMAPEGKTVISVTMTTKHADEWIFLRERDPAGYREQKEAIAAKVIELLDQKLGNIKDKVEVVDVATPATFLRYTGNWKGSMQGWMPTENLFAPSPIKNTLPGLSNFYMTGHWMVPGGGLPIALQTGRNITQIICKNDKRKFHVKKLFL